MPPTGYTKRRPQWTTDAILEKFHEWNELHGEPPTASDWNPADCLSQARRSAERARAWSRRAERFYDGEFPWTGSVFKKFGGWNNALRAADLPVRWGKARAKLDDASYELEVNELRTLVDQAEAAMVEGDGAALRARLAELGSHALAWAEQVPDEEAVEQDQVAA